jgi:hypothetical protein
MGLLGKAVLNEQLSRPVQNPDVEKLDEMGKALRDRLLSLSGTEPETAISLLKAYGSFRVGACLSLDGGLYRSYAAVGTGNPIELSPDMLQKTPEGNRYSVSPGDSLEIRSIPAGTKFWAFSLDENDGDPPSYILLVGEDKNYIFPGKAVASLVQATKSVFIPSKETEQAREETEQVREEIEEIIIEDDFPPAVPEERLSSKKTEGGLLALAKKRSENVTAKNITDAVIGIDSRDAGDDSGEGDILSFLSAVLKKNGSVHGLVFEGQVDEFAARIRTMVSGFADTIALGAERCLIVGGRSLDCELLSHRLSASLSGKQLACFSAEDPGEALGLLRAYL